MSGTGWSRRAVCRAGPVVAAALTSIVLAASGCAGAGDAAPEAPRVLQVRGGEGASAGVATGMAVADGRVLTVAHVLDAGPPTVLGRRARVLRVDRRADLALLAVPAVRAPALRLGDGEGAVTVRVLRDGRPHALAGTVRRHVTARVRAQPGDRPLVRPGLEVGAVVSPGDSGAPVLDGRGRVLGVVFARASAQEGTAWAVSAAAVRPLLDR
jgi:S1-C subfamily serine protease